MNIKAQGTINNFGYAPYQDKQENQQSFFIEIKSDEGLKKVWGLGIKEALDKSSLKKGDYATLLDRGITDEKTKKRGWELQAYEPLKSLNNSISNGKEHDKEQVKSLAKNLNFDELELPTRLKNQYHAMVANRNLADEKVNFYDKADPSSVAFEDRNSSLHTSKNDTKTVNAMLDLASAKGWESITLSGNEDFKKVAWLEASLRGIQVKGYEPNEKDIAELRIKQEEYTRNSVKENENTHNKEDKSSFVQQPDMGQKQDFTSDPFFDMQQPDMGQEQDFTSDPFFDMQQPDMGQEQDFTPDPSVDVQQPDIKSFKNTIEVKDFINKKLEESLNSNLISNRDDVIQLLKKQGFDVVKEEKESLSIANPVGVRNIKLQDKPHFQKDFIKTEELQKQIQSSRSEVTLNIGNNSNKGLDKLIVELDAYKDKISQKDLIAVEAFKSVIEERFRNNPVEMSEKLNKLAEKIPEIANGQYELPAPPTLEKIPEVSVQQNKSNQDRSR